jgi:hypothetical protein
MKDKPRRLRKPNVDGSDRVTLIFSLFWQTKRLSLGYKEGKGKEGTETLQKPDPGSYVRSTALHCIENFIWRYVTQRSLLCWAFIHSSYMLKQSKANPSSFKRPAFLFKFKRQMHFNRILIRVWLESGVRIPQTHPQRLFSEAGATMSLGLRLARVVLFVSRLH